MIIVELQYPLAPSIDLPLYFVPHAAELNGATLSVFGVSTSVPGVTKDALKIVRTGESPPSLHNYLTYLGNGLHLYSSVN